MPPSLFDPSRRLLRVAGLAAAGAAWLSFVVPAGGVVAGAAPAPVAPSFMTAKVPAGATYGEGSGSGFCGSISGAVNGQNVTAYNLGPNFDNVYACGPTEEMGWNNDPFESDFQCVELSTRFMWDVYGLRAAPGDGINFVADNHARFPSIAVGTPGPGSLPAPGDVVSMGGGAANPNASPWGHTAVVSDVSHVNLVTGNGYITLLEENDGGVGSGRINVTNWRESDGNPQYANGLYWYTDISWLELASNPTTAPGAASEARVCTTCSAPLVFHGGTVMGTPTAPGDNTVTSVYWTTGSPMSTHYQAIIDGYLGNVASANPAGDVFAANPLYGDSSATSPPFTFGGHLVDTDALPASGCTPDAGFTACVTDQQVQAEVTRALYWQVPAAPADLAHLYVLYLPPGVESCSTLGVCSASEYCGYHGSAASAGGTELYAVVPYPRDGGVCETGQAPNGDLHADGAVDTTSRLVLEAATDPLGTGWTDASGNEIGAECANQYGAAVGSTDAANPNTTRYNQVIGAGRYYTQEEFSNAAFRSGGSGCVLSAPVSGASPAAQDSVVLAPAPGQVPNDGVSTSAVTVKVQSPQHAAVPGDAVHITTYTRSGTCGTVSPSDVVTDASGSATTTYTASTQDATCTVVATESATGQSGHSVVVQGVAGVYHPLTPVRVADTRSGSGLPLAGHSLATGGVDSLTVAGANGVPADATAVVLNVTATGATMQTYLTVYPAGSPRPLASDLNVAAAQTVANLVTVPVGSGGAVDFFNYSGSTDAVVDLEGYMEAGNGPSGLFNAVVPYRLTDTRPGSGQANAGASLADAGTLTVPVAGTGAVPSAGVSAVVLNVTAVGGTRDGYLTAYPSNAARPLASNLNFLAGQAVPNRVIVPVGPDGAIKVYNFVGTVDVVVDVSGWFTDGSNPQASGYRFTPLAPMRVIDTRSGAGEPLAGSTLSPQGSATSAVAATASLPSQATAIAANVTVTGTTSASFLTAYPSSAARPSSSDLNWVAGETVPNMLVTGLGNAGSLSVYNLLGQADVVVDVFGFWS